MKSLRFALFVVLALSVMALSGCGSYDYYKATRTDTIEAFRGFLNEHPSSPFKSFALSRLEDLVREQARKDDRVSSYLAFLAEFPEAKDRQSVEQRVSEKKAPMFLGQSSWKGTQEDYSFPMIFGAVKRDLFGNLVRTGPGLAGVFYVGRGPDIHYLALNYDAFTTFTARKFGTDSEPRHFNRHDGHCNYDKASTADAGALQCSSEGRTYEFTYQRGSGGAIVLVRKGPVIESAAQDGLREPDMELAPFNVGVTEESAKADLSANNMPVTDDQKKTAADTGAKESNEK
ncbi:MAG: hypothetical protein KJ634_01935 [Gammaproteobacteria bacterium]|nr:hypothetical protein [Gammaproteobacteria bacterium]MBU1414359.1 hypothetical protein [Gammaproteobacteria bacterium]